MLSPYQCNVIHWVITNWHDLYVWFGHIYTHDISFVFIIDSILPRGIAAILLQLDLSDCFWLKKHYETATIWQLSIIFIQLPQHLTSRSLFIASFFYCYLQFTVVTVLGFKCLMWNTLGKHDGYHIWQVRTLRCIMFLDLDDTERRKSSLHFILFPHSRFIVAPKLMRCTIQHEHAV